MFVLNSLPGPLWRIPRPPAGGEPPGDPYVALLLSKGAGQILTLGEASGAPLDSSGNGRDGTYQGSPSYQAVAGPAGIGGLAVQLPSGTYIEAPYSGMNLDETTFLIWFQALDAGLWSDGTWRALRVIHTNSGHLYGIYKTPSANQLYCFHQSAAGIRDGYWNITSPGVDWTLFTVRVSVLAGTVRLSINGANVTGGPSGIGAVGGTPNAGMPRLANNDAGNQPMPGNWAYYAAFPSVLSDGDVSDLYVT